MKEQLTSLITRGLKYLLAIVLAALVAKGVFSEQLAEQLTAEASTVILGASALMAAVLMACFEWAWKKFFPRGNSSDSGAGSGGSLVPLILICTVAASLLPSCGNLSEYPVTGGLFYRDPSTGAKAGLKFQDGKGSYYGKLPLYDDQGNLVAYTELEGPLSKRVVTAEK